MLSLPTLSQLPFIAGGFFVGAAGMFAYLHPHFAATTVTQEIPAAVASIIAPAHTVSWFVAHQSEMHQKLAVCADNSGSAVYDPECQNAVDASDKVALDRFIAGAHR